MPRVQAKDQHALFAALYTYFTTEGFRAADPTIPAGGAGAIEFDECGDRMYTVSKQAMHNTVTEFQINEYDPAHDTDEQGRDDGYIDIRLDIAPADSTWPHTSIMRIYNTEYITDAIDSAWWYINHLFDNIDIWYESEPDGWDAPYLTTNTEHDGRIRIRADLRIYNCTED